MNLRLEVKRSVATLNDSATELDSTRETVVCQTKTSSDTHRIYFSTIDFVNSNIARLTSSRRVWHALRESRVTL